MTLKTVVYKLLHPQGCNDSVRDLDGSTLRCSLPKRHVQERHQARNGCTWRRRPGEGIVTVIHPEDVHERDKREQADEIRRLRGYLRWMMDHASDEQLLAWADDAGKHIAEMEDTDPDWVRRYADQLTSLSMRLDQAVNDQDWDIKISGMDREVRVVGSIPRERVPGLLYRLAVSYGEDSGTPLERSLRWEVDRFRLERNEARDRLERIAQAHTKSLTTGGMTDGTCIECGETDPCPTRVWATTEGRNPVLNTWDPADDSEPEMEA
ncbi:hypothetical protein ACFW2V_13260 [Streptomyces sp. NPDC058947]|uniref:hypothetical protein n=1 Tax=Streptomyces sp. NPDC058947 TaxID=3346675 RepID=UPI0036A98D3F